MYLHANSTTYVQTHTSICGPPAFLKNLGHSLTILIFNFCIFYKVYLMQLIVNKFTDDCFLCADV